jgi:hypothetical protein
MGALENGGSYLYGKVSVFAKTPERRVPKGLVEEVQPPIPAHNPGPLGDGLPRVGKTVIRARCVHANMCHGHYTAEEWDEVVRTLVEEDPEEEFKTEREEEEPEEATEENERPVPADD